jgi:heptose I phosphotransferase
MILELSPQLRPHFSGADAFDSILRLDGETYRRHKNRRTFRVVVGGTAYFVKVHGRTSWREVLKNRLRLREPVLNARPEFEAIGRLQSLGVPTVKVAGYGLRGQAPTGMESFIITESLESHLTLDEAVRQWEALPDAVRIRLTGQATLEIAEIARKMHEHGLNHRDFYLCHFMLEQRDWPRYHGEEPLGLRVIDLHRVQLRHRVPARWIMKDLAGLLFSSLDAGLGSPAYLRFLEAYFRRPWREVLDVHRGMLRRTVRRAIRQYRAEHGRRPELPAFLASFA